jgi:hypothetical protein
LLVSRMLRQISFPFLWQIHIFFPADILELLAPTSIDYIFSSLNKYGAIYSINNSYMALVYVCGLRLLALLFDVVPCRIKRIPIAVLILQNATQVAL